MFFNSGFSHDTFPVVVAEHRTNGKNQDVRDYWHWLMTVRNSWSQNVMLRQKCVQPSKYECFDCGAEWPRFHVKTLLAVHSSLFARLYCHNITQSKIGGAEFESEQEKFKHDVNAMSVFFVADKLRFVWHFLARARVCVISIYSLDFSSAKVCCPAVSVTRNWNVFKHNPQVVHYIEGA